MNIKTTTDAMRFTHFSSHALKRVKQRTKLSPREVGIRLDQKLVVNTGIEPGLNREHLLFYSEVDDCCFVAIRDALTGEVITVLPLEYHQNLAWEIKASQISKAKELGGWTEPNPCSPIANPSVFIVRCTYIDDFGKTSIKLLLKVMSALYQDDIDNFMFAADTPDLIEKSASMKELDHKQILTISVRLGNKGKPQTWVLRERNWLH